MAHQVLFRSVLVAVLVASMAFAATLPPIVYTAEPTSPNTLTITGLNFSPFGNDPTVTLGGITLVLDNYSNAYILAVLPSNIVPGTTVDRIITASARAGWAPGPSRSGWALGSPRASRAHRTDRPERRHRTCRAARDTGSGRVSMGGSLEQYHDIQRWRRGELQRLQLCQPGGQQCGEPTE